MPTRSIAIDCEVCCGEVKTWARFALPTLRVLIYDEPEGGLMTVAEQIRALAQKGSTIAEIAHTLNIRYQHAYNVLKRSNEPTAKKPVKGARIVQRAKIKPELSTEELTRCGFQLSAKWILAPDGSIRADQQLPKEVGVYAFAKGGLVLYIGVATMGLAKRLYFYSKPGATQRTSLRINAIIRETLQTVRSIEIYTATPKDLDWNGLPIHASAGLELGMIKKYSLPWNVRSAG